MPTVKEKGEKLEFKNQNVTIIDADNNLNLTAEEISKNGQKWKGDEEMPDPAVIKIENFEISSEANDLFINGSLLIVEGNRYGLVGMESCEITALLKHIAEIDSGIDVVYWDENIVDNMLPVETAVLKPSIRCDKLLKERESLFAEQDNGNNSEDIRIRLAELWEELLLFDPNENPAKMRAVEILAGLQISDVEEPVKNLPKHLRMKVSLARALYLEPKLLILDEPTAELDLDSFLWLENYLQDWKKTLIIGSQDRCFLDNVCCEIIHVSHQQLSYYKGNYSNFEKVFAQKQRKSLKKKIKRKEKKLQLNADEKSIDTGVKTRSMLRRESQDGSEVNDSGEGRVPVKLLQKPKISFCDPVDFKKTCFLQLLNVTFGYEEDKLLFEDLSIGIEHSSRIAVFGPSEEGKSTLLKIANGELNVVEGEVKLQPDAIIGKFSQNDADRLPLKKTPLEYLCRKAVDKVSLRQKAVEKLIGLGLPNNCHSTKIEELTGNEKALVALAELCLFPHDGLLLDDPTKNMSMDFIDALADAINQFKGAVLLVTNNQFLIRETDSNIYLIDKKFLVELDTLEDYRRKLLTELDVPIRGPFIFKKRTQFKREISPTKFISDSETILNYIDSCDDVEPTIKNIGEYRLIFREGTNSWYCLSPTLNGCEARGRTKEICIKNMMLMIELTIESLINEGKYVPPPP